ncbi:MAG: 3-keto-disaccharide hydrolase [Acidobacteriota bacterium]
MVSTGRIVRFFLCRCMLLVLLAGASTGSADRAFAGDTIIPTETIHLFNGNDLSNFYSWLVGHKYADPDKVFSVVDQVDGAPAIRASGQHWGGLVTKQSYANYHLIVEFRWGSLTWGTRKNRTMDNGILLHCQGPDGNAQPDFSSPWMRSVEFQIIEGGVGDIILVAGHNEKGERLTAKLTTTASQDRDGEWVWDPKGQPRTFEGGRINWWGRDPDWKDELGFRGKREVEKPVGQWNRLDAYVEGDSVTYFVNGQLVNRGNASNLTEGKLLFQSEGAETFFRRIELRPLPPEKDFVALFDGTTLDGWVLEDKTGPGYLVENGKIVCPRDGGGNLFTAKEYSDFILRFEFKLETGSNNGLAIRSPRQAKDIAYEGIELQIIDNDAERYKDIQPWQKHGSLYHVFPAKTGFLKPAGQWNEQEVVVQGRQVKVILNGHTILDANLDDVKDPELLKKHPGLQRKTGHIGFLGHNEPVEFRKIRIKEL